MVDLLSTSHRTQLEASAISPEIIDARGYRTVEKRADLKRCGFSDRQALVPALLVPVWGVDGQISIYQARPDAPRIVGGKPNKYETPRGARMVLDIHPHAQVRVADPTVPLFITEGVKKGDSLVSRECCTVSLLGVWNWRGSNSQGGKTALDDWESIALNDRQIYIIFDSDVMLNPKVHSALSRLKGFLEMRRASVALIYLPSGAGGNKIGVDDYLAMGNTLDGLLALATKTVREPRNESSRESGREHVTKSLPEIIITGRHLREIASDSWRAVLEANKPPSVFQRGQLLVDIIEDDNQRPTLRTLDRPAFKGIVERVADFMKETDEGLMPARVPSDVVADMMSAKGNPLPLLTGIVEAPIIARHGAVVTTPGYQVDTRAFLHLAKCLAIPEVNPCPTDAEVDRARSLLMVELLGDFPFMGASDRAHAVGVEIQPFARLLIDGPTPLNFIESPTPATGKGLLGDVLTIPAAGRGPAVMTDARDEDEWRKRITAKLLQSPQFILIDNVRSRLDSAALSAALTSEVWEDRVLGQSRTATVPVSCTWLANGNNPTFSLEMARRTVSIRIDAECERPWERIDFRHPNLRRWAREHRGDLIWASLTLIRLGSPLEDLPARGHWEAMNPGPR